MHHLHLGVYAGSVSAIVAIIGVLKHNLTLCGWSALAGVLMFGWAFDDFLSEQYGAKMPTYYLDRWMNKFWLYDRAKKWVNKILYKKETL